MGWFATLTEEGFFGNKIAEVVRILRRKPHILSPRVPNNVNSHELWSLIYDMKYRGCTCGYEVREFLISKGLMKDPNKR